MTISWTWGLALVYCFRIFHQKVFFGPKKELISFKIEVWKNKKCKNLNLFVPIVSKLYVFRGEMIKLSPNWNSNESFLVFVVVWTQKWAAFGKFNSTRLGFYANKIVHPLKKRESWIINFKRKFLYTSIGLYIFQFLFVIGAKKEQNTWLGKTTTFDFSNSFFFSNHVFK